MMPPLELAAHLLISLRRTGRAWRIEQLMPSILFDNDAKAGDLGITLEDIAERHRRSRGR